MFYCQNLSGQLCKVVVLRPCRSNNCKSETESFHYKLLFFGGLLALYYICGEVTARAGEFTVLYAVAMCSPSSEKGKIKGIKHILHVVVTKVQ